MDLTERVQAWEQEYCQPLALPLEAYHQLRGFLQEAGYRIVVPGNLPTNDNPQYQKTVHARHHPPPHSEIDLLIEYDVKNLSPGFTYLQISTNNPTRLDSFRIEYAKFKERLEDRTNLGKNLAYAGLLGGLSGGILMPLCVTVMSLDPTSQSGESSGMLGELIAGGIVGAVVTTYMSFLYAGIRNAKQQKIIDQFLLQYKPLCVTGRQALRKALLPPLLNPRVQVSKVE